ncbi:MAG: GNAT family N-acetyltransferase [Oscillospiraceae bacterium]|jgi:RimJ/RimL family protein N-acetyltransferase|nr:GNAT family N-acetyltransferase [Oscillospiraceae bacterium]
MLHLETKRLLIRNYILADIDDYYEYMSLDYTAEQEDFEPFSYRQCMDAVNERLTNDSYMAVVLKEKNKMIGDLCYRAKEYETFEIAYDFNVAYEKNGYATEACRALVDFLFNEKEARRVVGECNDTNLKSVRLLERLGFRREGHFLEDVCFKKDNDGSPIYVSSYYYAMLKHEWKARIGEA